MPCTCGEGPAAIIAAGALTEAVRKAASASGSTYVDVWKLSQGHDICSDDPWINGATNVQGKAPRYHPFAARIAGHG